MSGPSTPSPALLGTPTLCVAEPPALYLMRPPLVVDCSALAGIVFQESWQQQAQQSMTGRTLHAPNLLPMTPPTSGWRLSSSARWPPLTKNWPPPRKRT